MSEFLNGRPPTSFWVVGGAALVWNLIGLVSYYSHVTMTPEALAEYTEAQQALISSTPTWATAAYAIAVNAGVLASLFLLLRKGWATPMFILSLLAIIAQDLHAFVLSNGIEVWGINGMILPAVIIVIGVALLWYSRSAKARGWLV